MAGLYQPVIDAVKSLDFSILSIFGVGCVAGLLTFSHVLSWMLKHYRNISIAFLTGLMLGALGKVWPWKETLTTRVNSSGEVIPLLQSNISPFDYEAITGQSAYLEASIGFMVLAIVLVALLEWVSTIKK